MKNFIEKYFLLITVPVFMIISLWLLWKTEYLPFQDYPSHLYRLKILVNYDNPAYSFSKYFVPNLGLIPNQLSDIIKLCLAQFFEIETSTRLFYSFYIILLPLSSFYFLKSTNPDNTSYTLLSSALTFNQFLAHGNENFFISIPFFLIFIGYYYRFRAVNSISVQITKAVLLIILYYCHMLTFLSALLAALIICVSEKKQLKALLKEALIAVPGILLFTAWAVKMKMASKLSATQITMISGYSSIGEKIQNLLNGTAPAMMSDSYRLILQMIFTIAVVLLAVYGLYSKKTDINKYKVWIYILGVNAVLALIMPRWFAIFEPGHRFAFWCVIIAPVVFPKKAVVRYTVLCFLVLFTFYVRYAESVDMNFNSKGISFVGEPFQYLPPEIKNKGEKVLPLVLYPYTHYRACHRVFDYYHIINGGANPYHITTPDYSVDYKIKFPAPNVYQPYPEYLGKEVLDFYDIVIIIGKDGERGNEIISHIYANGFKEARGNGMTGIYVRK